MTQQEAEKLALDHYYLIKHKIKLPDWPESKQILSVSAIVGVRDINDASKNIYEVLILCTGNLYVSLENAPTFLVK